MPSGHEDSENSKFLDRAERRLNAAAAMEGLTLFADHTNDAEKNPGKHPNIDRLLKGIEENQSLSAKVTRK